jgi:hypothetical protein
MRAVAYISVVAILSGAAYGQSTETASKFEAADIHESRRTSQPILQGPFVGNGLVIDYVEQKPTDN